MAVLCLLEEAGSFCWQPALAVNYLKGQQLLAAFQQNCRTHLPVPYL